MCTYKGFRLPENMSDTTSYFVKGIISKLKADNKIDDNDSLSIYLLAEAMEEYIKAKQDIDTHGSVQKGDSGRRYVNPSCNLMHIAYQNIMSILKQYGLTTMSKGKIKYVQQAQGTDPLIDLLKEDED